MTREVPSPHDTDLELEYLASATVSGVRDGRWHMLKNTITRGGASDHIFRFWPPPITHYVTPPLMITVGDQPVG